MVRSDNKQHVRTSIRVLQFVMLGLCLVVFGRIFQLQILDYDTYSPLSRKNSLRQEIVNPARGLIYDRNGKLLVDNEPTYTITITPANFDKDKIPLLADLMKVPDTLVTHKVKEARAYSWYRSSRLFTEVSFKTFSRIEENSWRLPGIGHQIESKRHYPTDIEASHVFGYLREISEQDYLSSDRYRMGDKIGKSGIEQVYEPYLRGKTGTEHIMVNALGQSLGPYENGKLDQNPVRGSDLITTLDADLQATSEKIMEGKLGGLVALDPNTGEVLSMVSSPQYDIKRLAGRIDVDYWKKVNADSANPLFNRAIASQQPPGSTIKPLMSLIGMKLGLITPSTVIHNTGAYYRGRAYHDHAPPGDYDMVKAIAHSSNTYFFSLYDKIVSRGHLNQWHNLAADFGLGSPTKIDLPNERSGILPDSTWMNDTYGKGKWGVGDVLSMGIGQGMLSVTPVQMAVVASAIANGGYRVQPHLVKAIRQSDGTRLESKINRTKIDWVNSRELAVVHEGMRKVVTEGGGRFFANPDSIMIAGKTGTAQNPHGEDHSWFIAFAPMNNPKIAVAVLVENAGFGSMTAAPIASLVIEKYLTGKIKRERVLNRMLNFEYKPEDFTPDTEE